MGPDLPQDRPTGLFVLTGFVVMGVVMQIVLIPPVASASAPPLRIERVSFAPVEPAGAPDRVERTAVDRPAESPEERQPATAETRDAEPRESSRAAAAGTHSGAANRTEKDPAPAAPATGERASRGRSEDPGGIEQPSAPASAPVRAQGRTGFQVMVPPAAAPGLPDEEEDAIPAQPSAPPGAPAGALQTGATLDEESLETQLVLLGPARVETGDEVTLLVTAENVEDLVHAPLKLTWDPGLLEFVRAEEGDLLRLDGAATVFMASEGGQPGQISIALSRMPPQESGANGSGVLCSVTMRAVAGGSTPVVLEGSRLLDGDMSDLVHMRNDSNVAID